MELKLNTYERIVYDTLADGEPHTAKELLALLDEDSVATPKVVHDAIYRLRKKLNGVGEDVVSTLYGKGIGYRRVRLLQSQIEA